MTTQAITVGAEPSPQVLAGGATRTVYVRLALVVFFWATSWLFMKVILSNIAPLTFTALRFAGAAVITSALALLMRMPVLPARGERLQLGLIGLLQAGGVMGLSTIALQYITVGRATVLVYTMQLWALPIGWLIGRERIKPLGWVGGLVGFTGIILFVNPKALNWHDGRVLFGNALLLWAAINWALGSCLYRRRKWKTPFWTQTTWHMIWCAVALTLAVPLAGHSRPTVWTGWVVAILVFIAVFPTCLGYWWWGKILTVMPASRAGQVICLVPVLATLMSAVFLHEQLTLGVITSMAVIGVGILLTLRSR
jgi:drug/metabolite transporter (DMT)-like permease